MAGTLLFYRVVVGVVCVPMPAHDAEAARMDVVLGRCHLYLLDHLGVHVFHEPLQNRGG